MSSDPYIHELLLQLNHELKNADTISDRDIRIFHRLAEHVQELIEKPEADQAPLTAKLEASIAEIESSHPTLAALMEQVASALSNTGI